MELDLGTEIAPFRAEAREGNGSRGRAEKTG